jgi:hypothetical protein
MHVIARSREGKRVSLNGWTLWEARKPNTGTWIRLDNLRPLPLATNGNRRRDTDDPATREFRPTAIIA